MHAQLMGAPGERLEQKPGALIPPPRSGGVAGVGSSEDKTPPVAALARGATLPLRGRDSLTWLALEPLTGRTHQLRVHCAAMGWPIVGDAIYGNAPRSGGPPLHLHAREVMVPLYTKREAIRVVAPVPEHMREALAACGWNGEAVAPLPTVSRAAP